MAAQQLAGEGFKEVINLKGGIRAWNGHEAVGDEDQGMFLFENLGSAEHVVITAYSLEQGLQDFYLRMLDTVGNAEVAKLFRILADVEDIHKERLFAQYSRLTGESDRAALERRLEEDTLEGGMTTDEYVSRFNVNFEHPEEVIGLAMSIEAQALDLYTRASRASGDQESGNILRDIAGEERRHLEQLGALLDNVLERIDE